jgi:hypothetical protein
MPTLEWARSLPREDAHQDLQDGTEALPEGPIGEGLGPRVLSTCGLGRLRPFGGNLLLLCQGGPFWVRWLPL